MTNKPGQPGRSGGGGAAGRRSRRHRALSRGQWAVFRERFQVEETVQPPAFADTTPLSTPLNRVLRGLGMDDVLLREKLEGVWPAVVGAAVARHARPGPMQGGRLTVYVDSPVWLSELSRQHQKRIRANLERAAIPVRELLFRIDPGEHG